MNQVLIYYLLHLRFSLPSLLFCWWCWVFSSFLRFSISRVASICAFFIAFISTDGAVCSGLEQVSWEAEWAVKWRWVVMRWSLVQMEIWTRMYICYTLYTHIHSLYTYITHNCIILYIIYQIYLYAFHTWFSHSNQPSVILLLHLFCSLPALDGATNTWCPLSYVIQSWRASGENHKHSYLESGKVNLHIIKQCLCTSLICIFTTYHYNSKLLWLFSYHHCSLDEL